MTRALIIALLLAAGPALADPAPPGIAAEHRLSPAEVDQVLAAAAARHRRELAAADAAAQLLPTPDVPPRGPDVHGEVGVEVGTGGYRSAYGSAVIGLGGDSFAAISLASSDFGRNWGYRRPVR